MSLCRLIFALCCLLPVAAAAIPVARACRMPVNAALRDSGIATEAGGSYLRRRIALPGVSSPLQLSIGNAFHHGGRVWLTVPLAALGSLALLRRRQQPLLVRV